MESNPSPSYTVPNIQNESPESIYYELNENKWEEYNELILKWIKTLEECKDKNIIMLNENEMITSHNFETASQNSQLLDNDINRTRVNETKDFPDFRKELKKLLIIYCELYNIIYKQGMNEIMAILYLMKLKNDKIEMYQIFNCFSLFLYKFFTNYFHERSVYSIMSSMEVVTLLLRFHEPIIFTYFTKYSVMPELYATNWVLTTFANKNPIEVTIGLWDFLISQMDEAMVYFVIVAVIKFHKKEIIDYVNHANIISYVCRMKIEDLNELKQIVNLALELKMKTPYSVYILIRELEIFKPKTQRLKEKYDEINLKHFQAFPIYPMDCLYMTFSSLLSCPDISCINFKNVYDLDSYSLNQSTSETKEDKEADEIEKLINSGKFKRVECQFCKDKKRNLIKQRDICVFDIRSEKDMNSKLKAEGILPNLLIYEEKETKKKEEKPIEIKVVESALKIGKNTTLASLTNYTGKFEYFESNLYESKLNEEEIMKIKAGLSLEPTDSILEKKKMKKYLKKNQDEKYKLEEYNNLKNCIKHLAYAGKTYISFAYGGYNEIHRLCTLLSIPLISHNKEYCTLCNEKTEEEAEIIDDKRFKEILTKKGYKNFICKYEGKDAYFIFSDQKVFIFIPTQKIKEKKEKEKDKNEYVYIVKQRFFKHQISFIKYERQISKSAISIFIYKNLSLSDIKIITLDFISIQALKQFYLKLTEENRNIIGGNNQVR
ncbi:MAG: TBC domain-containing protein [archaeon]|nr:TBC domain-containing protein [archaeon]